MSSSSRSQSRRQPPKGQIRTAADRRAIREGCWWDASAADRVRDFFEGFLRHSKGEWAGKAFKLLRWQWQDVVRPLFAWKRPDGTRRFRKAYIEVPKKNGKSTLCAGLSLYMLIADGEAGAEVYSAAADREQASIIFREAAEMVKASTDLSDHVQVVPSTKRLVFPRTGSFYKALSAEVSTKEGLNISSLIFDELHAQRKRDLWDALLYGGASRSQPLLIAITTAGFDRDTICWEQHDYARQVLNGVFEDTTFFAYIAAADDEDDWRSPRTWRKANPSYGVTIQKAELQEACEEAQASPAKENTFRRYRLDQWTEQDVRWLSLEAWDACATIFEPADLAEDPCYGGLDLSTKLDLTAFVLVWPPREDGELWCLLPRFWIPEGCAHERERRDGVPYSVWTREGWISQTPGNVIDYNFIEAEVLGLRRQYRIESIGFDPWNAQQTATNLSGEGLEMIEVRQGFKTLSEPLKELQRLAMGGELAHGGHPVLRWCASNVAVREDPAENIKPVKTNPHKRIDGIVATVTAMAVALAAPPASVYERRGLVTI